MASLTPTQRMAAILRHLARAERGLVSTVRLRRLCPDDYEIRAGMDAQEVAARERKFRHDIQHLRRRELIETGFTTGRPDLDNRQGVRLVRYMKKDPDLHLRPEEHEALARARARLGRPVPGAGTGRGRGRYLDLGLAVVRHLEEHGTDWVSGRELAAATGVRRGLLLDALAALADNPVADPRPDDPVVDDLEVVFPDDGGSEDVDFLVRILEAATRDRVRSASPTYGRGLHHLGRFAYTHAETDERLDLVAVALQDPRTPADDVEPLTRARARLLRWHLALAEREWGPDDCAVPTVS
ncbi:hypothetical protein [Geodermatophilus sp. SYSU D01119]